ncbi:thermonuclease family protein [Carnobacterium funditum]|uniref:thermonuclease family protein n=1 Tax=Carnobacterium funditum TaxID=2752 RepID=UPI000A05E151|nr:hypothetical protein [Carnobacterium funditum]
MLGIIAVLLSMIGSYFVLDSPNTNSLVELEAKGLSIELERVINGDTIIFNQNGESQKIRLFLMNTSESTIAKTGATQLFGKESKECLSDYLMGKNELLDMNLLKKKKINMDVH